MPTSRQTPGTPRSTSSVDDDVFTLSRLLVLVAGVSVGLAAYGNLGPPPALAELGDFVRIAWSAVLHGLSLPAPWFVVRQAMRKRPITLGAYGWLTYGLGAWIMLPLALHSGGDIHTCLHYVMSLGGFFYTLAGIITRQVRLRHSLGWTERMGWLVLCGWFPLGLSLTWDLYAGAYSLYTIDDLFLWLDPPPPTGP